MKLEGKVAVVTGAGAGLGRAVAMRFAQEGARVAVVDRDAKAGETVAREIGSGSAFVETDVADETSVEKMASAVRGRFGNVNVLYNNAAVFLTGQDARVHELHTEVWDRTCAVNLRGAFLVAKHLLPLMMAAGGGSVIQAGSPTGLLGCAPDYAAYSASKGGAMSLARAMANGYARDNIRVNILVPGPMRTPMTDAVFASVEARREQERATMLGRLGAAEDVCGLAVFLASDDSAYCTGGFYMADGGLTAL